jgi:hypothetical protein
MGFENDQEFMRDHKFLDSQFEIEKLPVILKIYVCILHIWTRCSHILDTWIPRLSKRVTNKLKC